MIVAPSIISGVMLLLSPLLRALECAPGLLKSINKTISTIVYLPVGLLSTILFVTISHLSLPFAYFYTIKTKYKFHKWTIMTGIYLPKS
jgi:hypothetical protein